jgi:YHS domain-containing protein
MKRIAAIGTLVTLTALGVLALAGCPTQQAAAPSAADPTSTEAAPTPAAALVETAAAQPPDNIGNAKNAEGKYICPVMGEPVTDFSKANSVEHQSKAYFFCCPGCKPKFEKDPEKYVKAATEGKAPESPEPPEAAGEHAEGSGGTR